MMNFYSLYFQIMTSTLWFWIMCFIALLIVLWIIKKIIWKVIIIAVCLAIIFFIFKLVAPASAQNVWNWVKDLPVKATNYVNTEILNKDIVLPIPSDITDSVSDGIENVKDIIPDVSIDTEDTTEKDVISIEDESEKITEEVDESRYSWFARLFKKNKDKEEVTLVEPGIEIDEPIIEVIEPTEENNEVTLTWKIAEEKTWDSVEIKLTSGAVVIETTNASWEKTIEEVVNFNDKNQEEKKPEGKKVTGTTLTKTWAVKTGVVETGTKEENEIVIIPSNPKNPENLKKDGEKATGSVITTKWGLTSSEINEVRSIFN